MCIRHDLKVEDPTTQCQLIQVLWETLDFQNCQDEIEGGGAAVHGRFQFLQNSLKELFGQQKVDRNQVKGILTYVRGTLFQHLNLYLSCLGAKQNRREKVIQIMPSIPQTTPSEGLESSVCKVVPEDDGVEDVGDVGPDIAGTVKDQESLGQADASGMGDTGMDQEDNVDPDDPLYGLDQRLKHSNLDDETRTIIKTRL